MSAIADLEQAKKQLEEAQKRVEEAEAKAKSLKETQREVERILKNHGVSAQDLVDLLFSTDDSLKAPGKERGKAGPKAGGTRKLQVYENPETGERVETRGANHKTLKAWREQYGPEKVRSWKKE